MQSDIQQQPHSNIGALTAANVLRELERCNAIEQGTADHLLPILNEQKSWNPALTGMLRELQDRLQRQVRFACTDRALLWQLPAAAA